MKRAGRGNSAGPPQGAAAERAGFRAARCSGHFHPWLPGQGWSGFAVAWLGAALQATALPLGVVNAPGQRYHPAASTRAEMFPGGSGSRSGARWCPVTVARQAG
jgi:hypothetical protein